MEQAMDQSMRGERGFSLVEVVIAVSLLAVGILGVASMQMTAIQGNTGARNLTEAASWGQDKLEELMGLPYEDPRLDSGSGSENSGSFTVNWTISDPGPAPNTRRITVNVSWQTMGRLQSLSLTGVKPRL